MLVRQLCVHPSSSERTLGHASVALRKKECVERNAGPHESAEAGVRSRSLLGLPDHQRRRRRPFTVVPSEPSSLSAEQRVDEAAHYVVAA
jgi:hypothetical protein